jgi:hypothetical protein
MFRTLFTAGTLLAAATAFAQLTSDYIRTPDGALVRAGDPKMQVIDKLGFPLRRQGDTYYYRVRNKLYRIEFKGDKVHWITRSQD